MNNPQHTYQRQGSDKEAIKARKMLESFYEAWVDRVQNTKEKLANIGRKEAAVCLV